MNVGQRVMVIATWAENACVPPPVGSIGEITEPRDHDGDYYVRIDSWLCPFGPETDWYVPHWALIPIDDGEVQRELVTAESETDGT